MNDQIKRATEVKQRHEEKWLGISGVTAVGIGKISNRIGIIISVDHNKELIQTQIPLQVEGIPVRIKLTGKLKAF